MIKLKAEQNKITKRKALINAALNEFSDKKFDEASLNTILANASVTKGAFYYSFEDKLDLYTQILKEISEQKAIYFKEKSGTDKFIQPDDATIFDFIKSLTRLGLGFMSEFPEYYKFGIRFTEEKVEFRNKVIGSEKLDAASYLAPMVKKALKNGDIDPMFSPEFAEQVINYMMTHYIDIIGYDPSVDIEKTSEQIRTFFTFLERGLGK